MAVCDVVMAAREARFALTEVRLGLIPATIGPYVVRRIGEGAARRLFFNPKTFGVEDAQAFQLVSVVTEAAGLDAAVEAEVKSFRTGAPGCDCRGQSALQGTGARRRRRSDGADDGAPGRALGE